ncbi:MAG TPA: hypothetical protein VGH12_04350 [Steroidobacteraceae bacterium]
MRQRRSWLLLALCAAANAAPPQATPASPSATPPPAASSASTVPPDEGFLEFLGSDDVGDTAWWEFLKKAPPHGSDPPDVPPQDAKK